MMPDDDTPFLKPSEDPDYRGLLGRFLVGSLVGEGTSCFVYRGWDPRLQREVALRVLKPALADDATARSRFFAENHAGASVEHPHILPVYEVSNDEDWPYAVVAFNEGQSLAEHLERHGTLSIEQVCRIGLETAQALDAMYITGIAHHDLTPANILLNGAEESVRVSDFGAPTSETATPLYRSPEQIDGHDVDHRTDFYSLGVVLYEMLEGSAPYQTSNIESLAKEIAFNEAPMVTREDCPAWLAQLVASLLEKSPNDRPPSAKEIIQSLEIHDVAWSRPKHARSSHRPMLITMAAIVLLGLGIFFLIKTSQQPHRGTSGLSDDYPVVIEGQEGGYKDLVSAIEAAPAGATVLLSDGIHEVSDIVIITRPVHLRASPGAKPLLRNRDTLKGKVFKIEAETTLESLTISHHVQNPNVGSALIRTFAPLTLTHCRVEVVWKKDAMMMKSRLAGISVEGPSLAMIHSEIETTSLPAIKAITSEANPSLTIRLDECAIAAATGISSAGRLPNSSIDTKLSKCHLLANTAIQMKTFGNSVIPHIELENSVVDVDYMLYCSESWEKFEKNALRTMIWSGRNNLYSFKSFMRTRTRKEPQLNTIDQWLTTCPGATESGSIDAPDTIILPMLPKGYRDMRVVMMNMPRITATDLRIQNKEMLEKYPNRGGDMTRVGPHSSTTR